MKQYSIFTKNSYLKIVLTIAALHGLNHIAKAQEPHLHINTKWEECSFQLNPSLSQSEWRQFTKEAGLVAYYRPLIDAKPMGVGKIDLSLVQWQTKIDESEGAWNNTFVHPDSTHWLVGGPRLPIPALTLRVGITSKMDVGVFWTQSPKANYSIAGAQVQYNLLDSINNNISVSSRFTYSMIYGPKDFAFSIYGLEVLASKKVTLYKNWLSVSPYVNASALLSSAREHTERVTLNDEYVPAVQAAVGAVAQISFFRIAAEYNFSSTSTLSYRFGAVLNIKPRKK